MSNKLIDLICGIFGVLLTGGVMLSCVDDSKPIPQPPAEQVEPAQYFGIPGGPNLPAGVECPLEQPKLLQGGNDY